MVTVWIAAFGVPLLAAGVIVVSGLAWGRRGDAIRGLVCRLAWLAAVPAGLLALVGDDVLHRVDWLLLGTSVQLDVIGRPLFAMAAVLYGLALAFVPRSGTERAPVLTGFLLLCFVGNAGVFVAADAITFYLAFTVMSFSGYALVAHDRTPQARRAARIYLVMTVLGEAAALSAIALIVDAGGLMLTEAPAAVGASAHRDLIVLLLLAGFGIKAGTVPLHVWLPLAHPAAPTAASAVLSGAMVKAGLIGWLRFLPIGEGLVSPGWGTAFILLALLGGFLAVPAGLLQNDPKVVLAYSTISQMGLLAVLIGVALAMPELAEACVLAAVVYAVHHGLSKGALFLGVQAWGRERLARWVVVAVTGVAALSIVGVPFTSGYVAKYGAKEAIGETMFPVTGGIDLGAVLPWVGLGSTLLMARFAAVMWGRDRRRVRTAFSRDIAWALIAVGAVVPVALLAGSFAPPQALPGWFDPVTLWDQSWPFLAGLTLAVLAAILSRRAGLRDSPLAHPDGGIVPPGDILTVEERVLTALGRRLARAGERIGAIRAGVRDRARGVGSPSPGLAALQARLGRWAVSGTALLVLVAAGVVWAVWMEGG